MGESSKVKDETPDAALCGMLDAALCGILRKCADGKYNIPIDCDFVLGMKLRLD